MFLFIYKARVFVSSVSYNVILLAFLRVLLPLTRGVAGQGIGEWNECPADLVTYAGCTTLVHALFLTTSLGSCSQDDIQFHVRLQNTGALDEMVESNGTHCFVSANVPNAGVGEHDLTFIAQATSLLINPNTLECTDHLTVKPRIPAPDISKPIITCEGVLVQWSPPVLSSTTVAVEGYTVYIPGTTLSYNTASTNTSLLIPYTDGLEYHTQYIVAVFAKYCGGEAGNEVNTTFTTTIALEIEEQQKANHNKLNNFNISFVTFGTTFKVSNNTCREAYPETVHTFVNCTGHQLVNDTKPVTVYVDGTIRIDAVLPTDTVCTVSLTFYSQELTTLIDPINIDTKQLQKCSFILSNQDVVILCFFASHSSLLGCRGVVIEQTSGWNMSVDIDKSIGYKQIPSLDSGVYNVTCYGLYNASSAGVVKSITYDDSFHSSTISVSSSVDNRCTTSISSSCRTSQQPAATISPTVMRIDTKSCSDVNIALIATLCCVVLVSIVCIISTGILSFFCGRNHSRPKHASVQEEIPLQNLAEEKRENETPRPLVTSNLTNMPEHANAASESSIPVQPMPPTKKAKVQFSDKSPKKHLQKLVNRRKSSDSVSETLVNLGRRASESVKETISGSQRKDISDSEKPLMRTNTCTDDSTDNAAVTSGFQPPPSIIEAYPTDTVVVPGGRHEVIVNAEVESENEDVTNIIDEQTSEQVDPDTGPKENDKDVDHSGMNMLKDVMDKTSSANIDEKEQHSEDMSVADPEKTPSSDKTSASSLPKSGSQYSMYSVHQPIEEDRKSIPEKSEFSYI